MVMIEGTLPLITVVQVILLLEVIISFIYLLIFIILNSKVWYLLFPLPVLELLIILFVFWDTFARVNKLFLLVRIVIAIAYFIEQVLFISLESIVIVKKYRGEKLNYIYLIFRVIFDLIALYFVWSLVQRRYEVLNEVVPVNFDIDKERIEQD